MTPNCSRVGARHALAAFFVFFMLAVPAARAQGKDWRPVTPAELQMKTGLVEPDADAEAIFWDVRVDDSSTDGTSLQHYVRVKIFTEKGKDDFSKHDIYFNKRTRIKDVVARVIKPDGSTVMLNKQDVFEREIVKGNGIKVRAKSFAIPSLEVGSIVEYRYKEVIADGSANMPLILQREVPIENVSYYVRPFSGDRAMAYNSFNTNAKFEKDRDGFYRVTMTNVPAFHEEPDMLPENDVKSWIYIYYSEEVAKNADEYWGKISKLFFDATKGSMKPNDEIKAATAQAIAGASTDEEKLHRIYDYVKDNIRNLSYADNLSDEDKKRAGNIKSASDTFKAKMAYGSGVDLLFGAMARSAGYEARMALSGDRSEQIFNRQIANVALMLNSTSVAVKVGGDWQFFSPASLFSPFGMLTWHEEGQAALITDPKELIWKVIPISDSKVSAEKRTGTFKLLPDGTLVGEGRIEFSGHIGEEHKRGHREDTLQVREGEFRDLLKKMILGNIEFESLTVENAKDLSKTLAVNFKIRVPGYAATTGKRIFLQPNVFERSSKPRFTASKRKYDVYLSYPFAEQDDITIQLPDGYVLESPDAPGPIRDPQGIGSHDVAIRVSTDRKTIIYKRNFSFGNGGFVRFPVAAYEPVKNLFEAFNKADVHQLTLKQDASAGK